MLFGRYRFECTFISDAELPSYKGSTFRGVFGMALKKVVCIGRAVDCKSCILKNQCLYVLVFETGLKTDLQENNRLVSPPHPFVIEPPKDDATHFQPGNSFNFNLLLFGNINSQLPYFIYAFEQMGNVGIGRKINGRRATFKLERVLIDDEVIYDAKNGALRMESPLPRLTLTSVPTANVEALQINLLTPLRLKYQNQLNPDLPFHVLVRALLRRVSSLLAAYDGGEPELDYKGLIHRAQRIETVESTLEWADWRRYSFRQKQEMKLGGLLGSITYQGNLNEYMPLIRFGQESHIGKQTAFGLGGFKL